MTTNRTTARWRQIAATSAIFIAAASAAAIVAPTSAAEPKKGQGQAFTDCVLAAWNNNPTMGYAEKQQVAEDCCLNLGGIFNEAAHTCYLPVNNITVEVPNPSPTPPPGATAILPPDLNTRGMQ